MRKMVLIGAALTLMLGLVLLAGCGGNDANAQSCSACGMDVADADAKTIDGKVYCSHCAEPMEKALEVTAVHDCDGGCGMTNVPEVQLTEVDGKYYCKGCMAKMEAEEHTDHEGHDH